MAARTIISYISQPSAFAEFAEPPTTISLAGVTVLFFRAPGVDQGISEDGKADGIESAVFDLAGAVTGFALITVVA